MEYQTVISQTGTEHLVNPKPTKGEARMLERVHALCHMSIRIGESAPPNGTRCRFCAAEAALIEGEAAAEKEPSPAPEVPEPSELPSVA